jgi:Uma2 family endonuclease
LDRWRRDRTAMSTGAPVPLATAMPHTSACRLAVSSVARSSGRRPPARTMARVAEAQGTMRMATTVAVASPPVERLLLDGVSWKTYESLMNDFRDRSASRFAYDQGVLEIASPTPKHEKDNHALARLVETVADTLDVEYVAVGSTTFKSAFLQKGFEPDSSFYIQHEAAFRDRDEFDPQTDPPPDLVIEIEITQPSLNKLPLYAAMGVPEVWRCQGDRVAILVLDNDTYRESDASLALPRLTGAVLSRFLVESRAGSRLQWIRVVRAWAREQMEASR